jgi:choline dehydrogenase
MLVDYVVVGGGSAGCVVASRLSEDPDVSVCLLEAGPNDWHPAIHIPAGMLWLMLSRRLNWQFTTRPDAQLANRQLFWPRGRMLGGSSSMNAMCYTRGHAFDYDHWAALGNRGWSYAEVLPYFKRSENQERGASEYHGTGGPLNVMDFRQPNVLTERFLEAAQQAGFPLNDDVNGAQQEGVGYFQVTQKNGRRCSAAKGFLSDEVRARPNLTILTGAQATRLLSHGRRFTGVEFIQGRHRREVHARTEVIVSAGAVQTPQLLMLSGVGDAGHLREVGIDTVHHLPGVGQNLQDHLDVTLTRRSLQRVSSGLSWRNMLRMPGAAIQFLTSSSGFLTNNGAEGCGFIKSSPDEPIPDLQLHFMPASLRDHGRDLRFMTNEGFTMHVCQLRPKSRGRITLASKDPLQAPSIDAGYLTHPDDLRTLVKGVRQVRRIFASQAFDPYRGDEVAPGLQATSDEALEQHIRQHAESIYHPVGTCRMGADDMAVVDDQLRVHGVQGLRVVDASIMPTLIGGNTNAPAIMIGEKAADMILQARRQGHDAGRHQAAPVVQSEGCAYAA